MSLPCEACDAVRERGAVQVAMSPPGVQHSSGLLQPGSRLDRFEIVRPLGHGLDTATYLARDGQTGERVVLKVPLASDDATAAARFRREAAIVRHLHHPNLQGAARAPLPRDA